MKILVIGSGGREHAICWKLSQSPHVNEILCAPGNLGTAMVATNVAINVDDLNGLVSLARNQMVDLTVVGPEVPLCAGIQNLFETENLLLAGPSAAAARLEGSKAFAKLFMQRHGIPTPKFAIFDHSSQAEAYHYIDENPSALVVKNDGLASGKGVFVCADSTEAKNRVSELLGSVETRVVIENRLYGEEVSFIVLTDGIRIWPLASSQDHKTVFDGDYGPNTGGMGAYSPAPVLYKNLEEQVLTSIINPVVAGMAAEGTPYRGVLYAGLLITENGVQVLEFNCRFGDPETQPLLFRLKSDLVPYLEGVARGKLPEKPPEWDERAALCVVMTSGGYPGSYVRGHHIKGIDRVETLDDVIVFHAGTRKLKGRLITDGGRVLGVTALGRNILEARQLAYKAVAQIHWDGVHFRSDIGYRALML